MIAGDQVRAMVRVRAPLEETFRVFTEEIDQWWRRGPRFRGSGERWGVLHLEPRVGGRLYETVEIDGRTTVLQTGEVTAWDPPRRLVIAWRGLNFAPDEVTTVAVELEPGESGTLVTVTHSGWSALRPDHPVRHRLPVPEFQRMMAMWWGDLLLSLRARLARAQL